MGWGGNFIILDRFASMDVLNQLVHLSNPLVVLLQASDLLIEQVVLFVTHLKVLLQALNISAELLVLICQLHVEILLEV